MCLLVVKKRVQGIVSVGSAIAALFLCAQIGQAQAEILPAAYKRHVRVKQPETPNIEIELPEKRPKALGAEGAIRDEHAEHERDDEDEDEDEEREKASAEEQNGIPPLPERAPIPSMRNPKIASEPYGPPPPPSTWSDAEIASAKLQCGRVLEPGLFDFKALPPLKEGTCGAPAPISLKYINETPKVEIRPQATITCELAAALEHWLDNVVQPRAKELLHANVIRIVSIGSYQCRTRYGNPGERISYHASANALDIAEFVTAKGEHIKVLDHWSSQDERGKFLHDAHDGACKIFGTVLGPNANAAHKNHFHVDMAKRRYSAYCQ